MERIGLFLCVLSVVICSVNCQAELAIDFIMQRVDNSTYTVTEAMVDSSSMERLNIVCRINNIQNIAGFNNINIYRVNKNGNIEHLATMQPRYSDDPGYQRPALVQSSSTMQAVGVYNDKNPTLGISVPVASLTCNDGLTYNCSLAYDERQGGIAVTKMSSVARNLTVSVQPKDVDLKAFNQSASFPMEIQSDIGTATNMAHFMIGQVVKITCKANLGTRSNGLISWRKSNIVAGSGMANYIPNNNEREDGQVVANGCQFEKTDSIMYNMTDQDAIRTSNNPLQFQCYISIPGSSALLPETTMKNFYIKVHNVNEPTSGGLATAGSGDAGVIAGAVIGSLVGIVIIVLLVYFLWYRRRAAGDDYTTKEEQGASNPNLAPEPQYAQSTKKGHENRGMDERTESSHRYANNSYDRNDRKDRHDRSDRNEQRGGGRRNHALDDDDEDYHSRDGSPTMNHSTHMGFDPEQGSIGTGV